MNWTPAKPQTAANAADARDERRIVKCCIDHRTNAALEKWAIAENRSLRKHTGMLLMRLTELYVSRPDRLIELGLMTGPLRIKG